MNPNYATEGAYRVYIDYLALKRHFTSKTYDYQKYNGKTKASFDAFQTRNDAFFFYKLSQNPKSHDLMLSNIVLNPNVWVRELLEDRCEEIYLDWKKRIDGLTHHFNQDLKQLNDDYQSNFVIINGQHPPLLSKFLQRKISLETFTILTNLSNVLKYWEDNIVDKIIASDKINLSKKYMPFLDIDRKKFATHIKSHIQSV